MECIIQNVLAGLVVTGLVGGLFVNIFVYDFFAFKGKPCFFKGATLHIQGFSRHGGLVMSCAGQYVVEKIRPLSWADHSDIMIGDVVVSYSSSYPAFSMLERFELRYERSVAKIEFKHRPKHARALDHICWLVINRRERLARESEDRWVRYTIGFPGF
jgi:hypothetical protein